MSTSAIASTLENEERVFGPPGTGKTTFLSGVIADLVAEHGAESLLVASFTRAAAAEMVGRNAVPSDRVKTLHAFGYSTLGKREIAEQHLTEWNTYVRSRGLSTLMLSEGSARNEDDLASEGEGQRKVKFDGDGIFARYQVFRARMTPENRWAPDVRRFHNHWTAWKGSTGYIDFTDMIEIPLRDNLPPPGRPRFFILDEGQDFTKLEITLARRWGQDMDKVIIGLDDDQALYWFKGGDAEACLDPDVPEAQKRILTQSYRVPRAVQAYAQTWIDQLSRRQPKEYRPRDLEGEVRYIAPVDDKHTGARHGSYLAPEAVLDDAERYLAAGKSVMFLTTCSYMLEPLKAVLRTRGIPFHNPYRAKRYDWNPLTPATGVASSKRLLDYLRLSPEVYGSNARLWDIEEFVSWTGALEATGVLKRGMRKEIEAYVAKLGDDRDLLTRELDMDTHLFRWMEDEAIGSALDQSLDWFEGHVATAKKEGMKLPLAIARLRGAAALMERPKVTIGTIHSVKGGQADCVYLFPDISLAASRDPVRSMGNEFLFNIPTAERNAMMAQERRMHADTLRRVFYVGMTRARESLIICPPAPKGPSCAGTHIHLPNPHLW